MIIQNMNARPMDAGRGRLSVLDLLILVAALAAGFAMTRSLPGYVEWHDDIQIFSKITVNANGTGTSNSGWSFRARRSWLLPTIMVQSSRRPSYWLGHLPYWAGPCLASLTVASTALALRGPRPRPSRLARRPGMAVGIALGLAGAVKVIQCLEYAASTGPSFSGLLAAGEMYLIYVAISLPPSVGYALAAMWAILALGGRWSVESNPGGRLCRGLGWCWIATTLIGEIGTFCFNLNC